MLTRTFIHLPGIGARLEGRLWRAGILSWDDFIEAPSLPLIGRRRQAELAARLGEDRQRLDEVGYWCKRLPPGEQWRLYGRFGDQTSFLDIETSGLTVDQGGEATVIGLFDGQAYRPFINGYNLEEFEAALEGVGLLVTFNGACFDLPFLKAYLRHLCLPPGHIDLRYTLKRLGLAGGLKKIEPLFGLAREEKVAHLDGWQAVLLWRRFLEGDRQALATLIRYNRADTINLKAIMDQTYHRLQVQMLGADGGAVEWRP